MLISLVVQNYALIEDLHVEFNKGMTVLLGETGAGKSILVDALGAALGARTSAAVVRRGAKKAVIEARFDSSAYDLCLSILTTHDVEWDNAELLIRREIAQSGTSRCFVNDVPTQATVLRDISSLLIDFHGQHDTHGLLSPTRHREIFDDICQLTEMAEASRSLYEQWRTCQVQLDEATNRRARAAEDRHRLERLIEEVSSVNPLPDEDAVLSADLERAESAEFIVERVAHVRDLLTEGPQAVQEGLRAACAALTELQPFSPTIEPLIIELRAAIVACNETSSEVLRLADPEAFAQDRIDALRQRWLELQRLTKTFGSLNEACEAATEARRQLETIDNIEADIAELALREQEARSAATKHAKRLSRARQNAVAEIETEVQDLLGRMGMQRSRFHVSIEPIELSPWGIDTVVFRIATNSGTEPQDLHKIASGGELSRVMLALKRLASTKRGIGTLVLDEIDTGISGRVARAVGLVMEEIAETSQIICITHLPQIASIADGFVKVAKHDDGEASTVSATALDATEAQHEIAALISGEHVTDAAVQSARELMSKHSMEPR